MKQKIRKYIDMFLFLFPLVLFIYSFCVNWGTGGTVTGFITEMNGLFSISIFGNLFSTLFTTMGIEGTVIDFLCSIFSYYLVVIFFNLIFDLVSFLPRFISDFFGRILKDE